MISAVEASLESPQLPPPSRDRLRAFLKLYRAAAGAFDGLRADVFVRRLIERVGFRRHGLFAASPETAERLVNLSRLADLAAGWTRRRPDGSTRDFVRYLAAVGEAGQRFSRPAEPPPANAVLLAEPEQVKGMDFERVYLLGLSRGALRWGAERSDWIPDDLLEGERPPAADVPDALRARRAYLAISRARSSVVLSHAEEIRGAATSPSPVYEAVAEARRRRGGVPRGGALRAGRGPARHLPDAARRGPRGVVASRRGAQRDAPRHGRGRQPRRRPLLRAAQARGADPAARAPSRSGTRSPHSTSCSAGSPRPSSSPSSTARRSTSTSSTRAATARGAARSWRAAPSLGSRPSSRSAAGGLALSASDVDLYRTCPLKYKFARVFAIPQEPTINQRFGILIHNVLERYHSDEIRGAEGGGTEDGVNRLLELFEAGWRRTGFGFTDDEMQYRDRAVAALARYYERHSAGASRPVWLERRFSFKIGETTIGGRVDRVDRHPDGSYELIDYKTGPPKKAADLADDLQIALYSVAAREAWDIEAADGAYWYVLDDEKVPAGGEADAMERVERTVADVATGITGQDFEPRPDFNVCSWCDYRLICPA